MTQEEKELLLKDLCARLPYGIWLSIKDTFKYSVLPYSNSWIEPCTFQNLYDSLKESVKDKTLQKIIKERPEYLEIKPYLRPMSSMTEKERHEYRKTFDSVYDYNEDGEIDDNWHESPGLDSFDWLNEHHFDYRGLIDKGLALEAPEDMYKMK